MHIQPTNGFDNSKRDMQSGDGTQNTTSGEIVRQDDVQSHAPQVLSSELKSMLEGSPSFTEIREGLVAKVQERLASGYYATREAAEQTATKINSLT